MNPSNQKGFTLIELLIVIAIIATLAGIVFVALDPATRFADARDAKRVADIVETLNAIKVDQIDNGGSYHDNIANLNAGEVYMIASGMTSGCNSTCDVPVTSSGHCVNLDFLKTEGYLGSIPVSGSGAIEWSTGSPNGSGYTLQRDSTGIVHIRSCESENKEEITVAK